MTILCNRCQLYKYNNQYLSDSKFSETCKQCLTNDELNDWIVSDISKAMKGLEIKEKQQVIRELVNEYRRKRNETKALH